MDRAVDLRSDTVTRPCAGMRAAMAAAEVGDDVLGEDPTLRELESRIAEETGKEAALYVVSGTMGNQLAIRSQTHHGDEILLDLESHIFKYESGAAAALSGVQLHPLESRRGCLNPDVITQLGRPLDDHFPALSLLCLENTLNRGGGAVVPLEALESAAGAARVLGASVHLDGARLWNASVATEIPIDQYAGLADTVMMCFSKGLGAPVGSVLAGSREIILRARHYRKMLGGGIRQGGVLAAACLYALDHHRDRLAEDHARCQQFARATAEIPGLQVELDEVETNMVVLRFEEDFASPASLLERFEQEGVRLTPRDSRSFRAVFHLDVDDDALERAIDAVGRALASVRAPGH